MEVQDSHACQNQYTVIFATDSVYPNIDDLPSDVDIKEKLQQVSKHGKKNEYMCNNEFLF